MAASAAAIECLRRGGSRGQARRAFWERYLGGDITDASDLKKEALVAGVILPAGFVAVVFDVEGGTDSSARDAVAQALGASDALCPLAGNAGARHRAVSRAAPHRCGPRAASGRACRAGARARRRLEGRELRHRLVSRDLLEVPVGLTEAREALALGRRLFGRGAVAVYPDLGIYALLHAGADRDAFVQFAGQLLDPLAAYDRKHKTDLLKTLQLYFEVGENVKEAAERLSVHRHTIFYRLNQISQHLKVDLKSSKDQLSLRAALAIRLMAAHEDRNE